MNKKKINLYDKFLGFLIKRGKKKKAHNILIFSFFKICLFLNKPLNFVLVRFFQLLNTYVETRTLRIRRQSFIVPFPISVERRVHLISHWLLESIKSNKSLKAYWYKFAEELLLVYQEKQSKTVELKDSNIALANINRSNIHYRW